MLELPQNLKPTSVVVKRLPTYLVGSMLGDNYLNVPTLQLTGSTLPCELELVYGNLPYYNYSYNRPDPLHPAEVCGFEFQGFDSAWAFFNSCQSGAIEFNIPRSHSTWSTLGISLSEALLGQNEYYWRITSTIKDSGSLKNTKSFTISIVQCSSVIATNILMFSIGSDRGAAVNQLLVAVAIGDSGINPLSVPTAQAASAINLINSNPASATAGVFPVDYTLASSDIVQLGSGYEVAVSASAIPVQYAQPVAIAKDISDSYQYAYRQAQARIVKN